MINFRCKNFIIVSVFLNLFYGQNAWALPGHKRLWERKYGYSVSCMLCHGKGGGSQLNSYGEDFQRFGMTPASFGEIEKRDSSKNGFTNGEKIRAKANPGDPLSTPSHPTDWLSRIEESLIPLEDLKKIFSDASKFSLLEGTLYPEQIKAIEKDLTHKLSDADTVPTFYFSIKEKNGKFLRTGVALFSAPIKNPEKLIVGVGIDLSGKIANIVLIKNKYSNKLGDQIFLSQFIGKGAESAFQIKKDIEVASPELIEESALVAEVVKKSLLTISAVFNKDKKTVKESR